MAVGAGFGDLVAPGRSLRPARSGIVSALPASDEGAAYDRKAAAYDLLVGSRPYNRLLWGTHPRGYRAFAAEALAASDGPFLDAGCGSAVFTAPLYQSAARPLVLVDRSLAMLERTAERLAGAPAALVQADLHDLPFSPGRFPTVACFAMLHVLDDPWTALAALRDQMAPGGRLFASMLVADRGGITRPYLAALHRAGELGPVRQTDELKATARAIFGPSAQVDRTGSMAWLRVS
jgi:ubiquinone/menaquinone biosynthesis C-methylase UbiE